MNPSFPLLIRRAQLRELLHQHRIGKHKMQKLLDAGRIQRVYLPGDDPERHRAFYCTSQVLRDVIEPMKQNGS